jgi:hypothetical protein
LISTKTDLSDTHPNLIFLKVTSKLSQTPIAPRQYLAFFIRRFSYQGAIIIGLAHYAIGALLAIPANLALSFPICVLGLTPHPLRTRFPHHSHRGRSHWREIQLIAVKTFDEALAMVSHEKKEALQTTLADFKMVQKAHFRR